jgi:hypothetical protein
MNAIKTVLLLGLAAALLAAGPSDAWAKECKKSKNRGEVFGKWKPSAKTTVKNKTAGTTILVEILRGDAEKQHKNIGPGEDASFLAKLGGKGTSKAELTVQLYPAGASKTSWCSYIVRETPDGSDLIWELPEGATEACPEQGELSVGCEIDFHKNRYRWHTIVTATDPQ